MQVLYPPGLHVVFPATVGVCFYVYMCNHAYWKGLWAHVDFHLNNIIINILSSSQCDFLRGYSKVFPGAETMSRDGENILPILACRICSLFISDELASVC